MDKKITRGINCNCPKCGNNFNVYVPQLFKDDDRTSPLNFGEYVEERIKSAHLKWNKEIREMIQSNKKEELPVGCGHNLYGYNLALDQLLKQLEEKP